MSDTSLYSGLYKTIDDYSKLVDRVLLSFPETRRSSVTEEQQSLGIFMIDVAKSNTGNLSAYMISQLLAETDNLDDLDLEEAGQALLDGKTDEDVRESIERFATLLDTERTKVMARIQGSR